MTIKTDIKLAVIPCRVHPQTRDFIAAMALKQASTPSQVTRYILDSWVKEQLKQQRRSVSVA